MNKIIVFILLLIVILSGTLVILVRGAHQQTIHESRIDNTFDTRISPSFLFQIK